MNMKYKYLLFDADNTLFDFNSAERRAFLSLSEIDSDVFTEDNYPLYHEINDMMWKKLERREITKTELKSLRFLELFKALSREVADETIASIVKTYPIKLALGTDLVCGAEDVLKNLSKNYEIYIITNGLYDVQSSRLEASVLKPYIKEMFVSEKLGCEKPSAEFFDYVLHAVGDIDRKKYVVIGDSLTSDIDGAISSGIDCIYFDPHGVGTKGRAVTHRISDLHEIPDLI